MDRALLLKWLPQLAFCLFLPAVMVVSWGELASAPAVVETHVWDKALHFTAYCGLSGILAIAFKGDRRVLTSTLLIALFGGVLEILQGVTGRDCSLFDEAANTLGAITGAGTGWFTLRLLGLKTLAARVRS